MKTGVESWRQDNETKWRLCGINFSDLNITSLFFILHLFQVNYHNILKFKPNHLILYFILCSLSTNLNSSEKKNVSILWNFRLQVNILLGMTTVAFDLKPLHWWNLYRLLYIFRNIIWTLLNKSNLTNHVKQLLMENFYQQETQANHITNNLPFHHLLPPYE